MIAVAASWLSLKERGAKVDWVGCGVGGRAWPWAALKLVCESTRVCCVSSGVAGNSDCWFEDAARVFLDLVDLMDCDAVSTTVVLSSTASRIGGELRIAVFCPEGGRAGYVTA